MQSTASVKPAQVTINPIRINTILVELKTIQGKGIDGCVIIAQIRSPGIDDHSQFFMVIITEQGRQRRSLIECLCG